MSRAKEAGACIYAEACKYIEKLSVEQCGQILINLLATTLPELGLKSVEITDGRTEVIADRIIGAAVRAMENFNNQKDNRTKGQLERWQKVKLTQNDSNCVKLSQNETYNINRTNIIESNKEIDKEKSAKAPKRNTPVLPTRDQIKEYCKERNNGIDADYFYDYYEARGWKYSNNQPMKDFKAAIRTWESKEKNKGGGAPQTRTHPNVLHQQDMVYTEF